MFERIWNGEFFNIKMSIEEQQIFCNKNDGKRPSWFNYKYQVGEDRISEKPAVPKHLAVSRQDPEFWKNIGKFAIPLRIKPGLFSMFSRDHDKLLRETSRYENRYGKVIWVIFRDEDSYTLPFLVELVSLEYLKETAEKLQEMMNNELKAHGLSEKYKILRNTFRVKSGYTSIQ